LNLETILKGDHPGTMQAKFGWIWFGGVREYLNVEVYDEAKWRQKLTWSLVMWANKTQAIETSK
jgi:hypothetical protein